MGSFASFYRSNRSDVLSQHTPLTTAAPATTSLTWQKISRVRLLLPKRLPKGLGACALASLPAEHWQLTLMFFNKLLSENSMSWGMVDSFLPRSASNISYFNIFLSFSIHPSVLCLNARDVYPAAVRLQQAVNMLMSKGASQLWTARITRGCERMWMEVECDDHKIPSKWRNWENFFGQPSSLGTTFSGWWYTYPSEKYELVSWDDYSQNIP